MFAFILYFFAVSAFIVHAQTPISEVPPYCSVPSANPVCPPRGNQAFNACGKYTRTQTCPKFCFAMLTQYFVGSGRKCFGRKPSFASTKRLYRACLRQCSYGRWKLLRSRAPKEAVLVSVGVTNLYYNGIVKASHLFYKLVKPTVCGSATTSNGTKISCKSNTSCQCWYCRHTGHVCPWCCSWN